MTLIGAVAQNVPNLQFGTSVVPTYPRHPMVMAEQAKTVSLLSGGRFTLGIGLSHQPVVEGMWGYSFDKPVRHAREYLAALMPLVRGEAVNMAAETITVRGQVTIDAPEPPVLLAALGPQMLRLAGAVCGGTITWMTGASTLASLTVPTISDAAEEAGRPAPEIVAGFPIWVTDDVDAAPCGGRPRVHDLRPAAVVPLDARPRRPRRSRGSGDHRRRGDVCRPARRTRDGRRHAVPGVGVRERRRGPRSHARLLGEPALIRPAEPHG